MASLLRSSNCAAYTDTLSTIVTGTATSTNEPDRERCTVPLPAVFSCQTSAFETPDEATASLLRDKASSLLAARGCAVDDVTLDVQTNLVGAQALEYSAEKLVQLGMTSNCFRAGNDPNDATHRATARCNPMREMTDAQGRRVINTNMQFLANLSVCDLSDEAMPQVMEDLRKVAAHNASQNGYTVDKPEDLACTFSVLPQI